MRRFFLSYLAIVVALHVASNDVARAADPEVAADAPEPEAEATAEADADGSKKKKKKGFLFPSRKKKDRSVDVAVAETPAEEPEEQAVADWLDEMDGEPLSEEQLNALRESQQAEGSEQEIIEAWSGAWVPVEYYDAPEKTLAHDPLFLDLVNPDEFDIPVEVNPWVRKWVAYFTGPGRKYYQRWLSRASRYQPMMLRELEEREMPRDLVYLSMIESGYNAHAYSHAAAAGLWQFISSTARFYDLRVDWWVDDRRDPEHSLHAALTFLDELHRTFGDWRLAWASYNTGPGRVLRATKKAGTKDFWVLADGAYLHSETDNYVPKIMAAAIIAKHPERYGFVDIEGQDELLYDVVKVEGAVELDVLAECAGVSTETIKTLNPGLRRYATPPEGYAVRVPEGSSARFSTALAKVPKDKKLKVVRHRVAKGETLSTIAGKYGSSVGGISAANSLKDANRIYVGMTLVIPRGGSAPPDQRSSVAKKVSTPSHHVVKRGDTLSGIASRYGKSTSELQQWNGIANSSRIVVGQKIALSGDSSKGWTEVTVKRGDSLGRIANKHGVTVAQLREWNRLNTTVIQPGQKLKLREG